MPPRRTLVLLVVLASVAGTGRAGADQVAVLQPRDDRARPLKAVTIAPDGAPAAPQRLATRGVSSYAVARGASGDAIVAWSQDRRIRAALRAPGAPFSAAVTLSGVTDARRPQVAMNDSGAAIVSWYEGGTLFTAARDAGGPIGPAVIVPEIQGAGAPAIDAAGNATLVGVSAAVNEIANIVALVRPPGGTFGGRVAISGPLPAGPAFAISVNAIGEAIVAWSTPFDEADVTGVMATRRSAAGAWSAAQRLTPPQESHPTVLAAAVGPTGAALVSWLEAGPLTGSIPVPFGHRVRAATAATGELFGAPATLKGLAVRHGALIGWVDDSGAAALSWYEDGAILAARAPPGGPFAAPVTVFGPAPRIDVGVSDPQLLGLSPGGATLSWQESDGTTLRAVTRTIGPAGPGAAREVAREPAILRRRPAAACRPPGSVTVAANAHARVYRSRTDRLYACAAALGVPREIVASGVEAVALAGPLVAYHSHFCEINGCSGYVEVEDLRDYSSIRTVSVPYYDGVLAIRLRSNGDLAWVGCSIAEEDYADCGRRPSGIEIRVGNAYADRTRRIGSGRSIVPSSLRLGARTVAWRENGRRRSAPFPR